MSHNCQALSLFDQLLDYLREELPEPYEDASESHLFAAVYSGHCAGPERVGSRITLANSPLCIPGIARAREARWPRRMNLNVKSPTRLGLITSGAMPERFSAKGKPLAQPNDEWSSGYAAFTIGAVSIRSRLRDWS